MSIDAKDDPANAYEAMGTRPKYYHRDGTPIVYDASLDIPEVIQWATYSENIDRKVRQTISPYGERLSTVFLGMDHNFFAGPPQIFETMLFAPDPGKIRRRGTINMTNEYLGRGKGDPEIEAEYERFTAHIEKNFPHDQLQLRYSNEAEAIDSHTKLRLQCLIPPRWRRLLCYEIGGDATWQ